MDAKEDLASIRGKSGMSQSLGETDGEGEEEEDLNESWASSATLGQLEQGDIEGCFKERESFDPVGHTPVLGVAAGSLDGFDDSCSGVEWSEGDDGEDGADVASLLGSLSLGNVNEIRHDALPELKGDCKSNKDHGTSTAPGASDSLSCSAPTLRFNPFRERQDIIHFPPWEQVFAIVRRPDEPSSGNGFTETGELDLSIETLSVLNTCEYTVCEKQDATPRRRSLSGADDAACEDYERQCAYGSKETAGVWCSPRPSTIFSKRAGRILQQLDSIAFLSTPNQAKKSLGKGKNNSAHKRRSRSLSGAASRTDTEQNADICNIIGDADSSDEEGEEGPCMADYFQSICSSNAQRSIPIARVLSPANKPTLIKAPFTPPPLRKTAELFFNN